MSTLLDMDIAVDTAAAALANSIAAREAFIIGSDITAPARNAFLDPRRLQSALLYVGISETNLGVHLSGSARRLRSISVADGVA